MDELDHLEDLFQINVFVYELQSMEGSDIQSAVLIKCNRKIVRETLNLNLCNNHFSYIFYFALYSHSYECTKCGKLWPKKHNCERHEILCDENVRRKYPAKAFRCFKIVF